jgi:hypothetical protein
MIARAAAMQAAAECHGPTGEQMRVSQFGYHRQTVVLTLLRLCLSAAVVCNDCILT